MSRLAESPSAAGMTGVFPDVLFDHAAFLSGGKPVGRAPGRRKVAIVGAGAAGLCAAYELARAGLFPVVFEAGDAVGGRLRSRRFTEADGSPALAFAELGAMRFPRSGRIFFHYADLFGLSHRAFPNPMEAPTLIHFRNRPLFCRAADDLPPDFARVKRTWEEYMRLLLSPLREAAAAGDDALSRAWQRYVLRFKDVSFYDTISDILPWDKDDMDRFGALGLGTGGFSPLFTVSFLEILRIMFCNLESDQRMMTDGTSRFAEALLSALSPAGGSARAELNLNARVEGVALENGEVAVETPAGRRGGFAAAIVTPTLPALESMGLTMTPRRGGAILPPACRTALRKLHHISSSKLFIRTRDKFWLDKKGRVLPGMPTVILSDEPPRAAYFLDYPGIREGVVCASYTWDDDAVKFGGMDADSRWRLFSRFLTTAHPPLAGKLKPLNGEIVTVDWHNEPDFFGAFKLNQPGQEDDCAAVYWQFLDCLDPSRDSGVYLAGDSVSWHGGWVEGALQTAINAACAVIHHVGGKLRRGSPLESRPKCRYR